MFCETKADFSAQHPSPSSRSRTSVPRPSSGWLAVMASSPLHNISAKVHSLQLSLASVCVCAWSWWFPNTCNMAAATLSAFFIIVSSGDGLSFQPQGQSSRLFYSTLCHAGCIFPVLLLPGGAFFGTFSATMTLESRVVERSKLGEKRRERVVGTREKLKVTGAL